MRRVTIAIAMFVGLASIAAPRVTLGQNHPPPVAYSLVYAPGRGQERAIEVSYDEMQIELDADGSVLSPPNTTGGAMRGTRSTWRGC